MSETALYLNYLKLSLHTATSIFKAPRTSFPGHAYYGILFLMKWYRYIFELKNKLKKQGNTHFSCILSR